MVTSKEFGLNNSNLTAENPVDIYSKQSMIYLNIVFRNVPARGTTAAENKTVREGLILTPKGLMFKPQRMSKSRGLGDLD